MIWNWGFFFPSCLSFLNLKQSLAGSYNYFFRVFLFQLSSLRRIVKVHVWQGIRSQAQHNALSALKTVITLCAQKGCYRAVNSHENKNRNQCGGCGGKPWNETIPKSWWSRSSVTLARSAFVYIRVVGCWKKCKELAQSTLGSRGLALKSVSSYLSQEKQIGLVKKGLTVHSPS